MIAHAPVLAVLLVVMLSLIGMLFGCLGLVVWAALSHPELALGEHLPPPELLDRCVR